MHVMKEGYARAGVLLKRNGSGSYRFGAVRLALDILALHYSAQTCDTTLGYVHIHRRHSWGLGGRDPQILGWGSRGVVNGS